VSRRSAAVELHVTDHGLGLPAAFPPAAFNQFTRPDGARTGTGSGLALVRAAAGRVTHRPDGGADVWITIPTSHNLATMTVRAADGSA